MKKTFYKISQDTQQPNQDSQNTQQLDQNSIVQMFDNLLGEGYEQQTPQQLIELTKQLATYESQADPKLRSFWEETAKLPQERQTQEVVKNLGLRREIYLDIKKDSSIGRENWPNTYLARLKTYYEQKENPIEVDLSSMNIPQILDGLKDQKGNFDLNKVKDAHERYMYEIERRLIKKQPIEPQHAAGLVITSLIINHQGAISNEKTLYELLNMFRNGPDEQNLSKVVQRLSQDPSSPFRFISKDRGIWNKFLEFWENLDSNQKILLAIGVPVGLLGAVSAVFGGLDLASILAMVLGAGSIAYATIPEVKNLVSYGLGNTKIRNRIKLASVIARIAREYQEQGHKLEINPLWINIYPTESLGLSFPSFVPSEEIDRFVPGKGQKNLCFQAIKYILSEGPTSTKRIINFATFFLLRGFPDITEEDVKVAISAAAKYLSSRAEK